MPRVSRPYHHGDLRRTLLAAAVAIVKSEGTAALTLRAVARRAGVSHQAPYHHFADRAALVAAVAQDGFERLAAELARVAAGDGDPVGRLRESGVAYVIFAVRHPEHFRVMFGPELADRSAHPELDAAARRVFDQLLKPAGELFPPAGPDSAVIGATLWSLVHGLAMLLIDGQLPHAAKPTGARQLVLAVTERLWLGLKDVRRET
jgi:AcrR family transcriptional regulator